MGTHIYTGDEIEAEDENSLSFIGMIYFPCGHICISESLSTPITKILINHENSQLTTADLFDLTELLDTESL